MYRVISGSCDTVSQKPSLLDCYRLSSSASGAFTGVVLIIVILLYRDMCLEKELEQAISEGETLL